MEKRVYIHIGGECSIPEKMIVGIFDLDEVTQDNENTKKFLKKAEEDGRIENISYDLPRSVIVALDKIYISPISAGTIRKRAERGIFTNTEHDMP
jgi:hypothetical protein